MFDKIKHKLHNAFIPPDENAPFNAPPGVVRPRVFLDIAIGEHECGRIEIELFSDITPEWLAQGVTIDGAPCSYTGATFHRVIPGFMIQGGDFVHHNGRGCMSIYNGGGSFPDENFKLKHSKAGLLSMANSGPNTNGCQFFITTAAADFLDGKHVVFGRVVDGMKIVRAIENTPVTVGDRPIKPCVIIGSGEAPLVHTAAADHTASHTRHTTGHTADRTGLVESPAPAHIVQPPPAVVAS
ncbi:hypothetical protein VHUM_00114 [Vanrija humicola]|uniref:Peptidyl-prolyl cis-trans isomerase n=1 Tax=Vanrija humicola TaxID=5417 RepID=A0A7D8VB67_VANHU|nr:hypothetical protein VHUM_00114 [Vanrija humicola]